MLGAIGWLDLMVVCINCDGGGQGGGTLLEIEPMDPHYRPDRRRGERGQGGGNRRHNGHDMMGGEGAERELYEDDETGEGGSGRRR